jgi:hypothetical protein
MAQILVRILLLIRVQFLDLVLHLKHASLALELLLNLVLMVLVQEFEA